MCLGGRCDRGRLWSALVALTLKPSDFVSLVDVSSSERRPRPTRKRCLDKELDHPCELMGVSHHSVDPRLRTDRNQTHINNPGKDLMQCLLLQTKSTS